MGAVDGVSSCTTRALAGARVHTGDPDVTIEYQIAICTVSSVLAAAAIAILRSTSSRMVSPVATPGMTDQVVPLMRSCQVSIVPLVGSVSHTTIPSLVAWPHGTAITPSFASGTVVIKNAVRSATASNPMLTVLTSSGSTASSGIGNVTPKPRDWTVPPVPVPNTVFGIVNVVDEMTVATHWPLMSLTSCSSIATVSPFVSRCAAPVVTRHTEPLAALDEILTAAGILPVTFAANPFSCVLIESSCGYREVVCRRCPRSDVLLQTARYSLDVRRPAP